MKERHSEYHKIEDILKEFVKTNKLQDGLVKIEVREAWENIMGNGINHYTTAIKLEHHTLYIRLSSSVLREELSYGKEKIITMLNEALGKQLIKKLVLC